MPAGCVFSIRQQDFPFLLRFVETSAEYASCLQDGALPQNVNSELITSIDHISREGTVASLSEKA